MSGRKRLAAFAKLWCSFHNTNYVKALVSKISIFLIFQLLLSKWKMLHFYISKHWFKLDFIFSSRRLLAKLKNSISTIFRCFQSFKEVTHSITFGKNIIQWWNIFKYSVLKWSLHSMNFFEKAQFSLLKFRHSLEKTK